MTIITQEIEHIARRVAPIDSDRFNIDMPRMPKGSEHWIGREIWLLPVEKMVAEFTLSDKPKISTINPVGKTGIPRATFTIPKELRGRFLTVVVPND